MNDVLNGAGGVVVVSPECYCAIVLQLSVRGTLQLGLVGAFHLAHSVARYYDDVHALVSLFEHSAALTG